jgi:hypothetical protein
VPDLTAGRMMRHARPGATWPVWVEDVLCAPGERPKTLKR